MAHEWLEQARRRAEGAARLEPLADGTRDPWLDPIRARPIGPSTWGMTQQQLREHANELVVQGWSVWEVKQVLAIEERPGCSCCQVHGPNPHRGWDDGQELKEAA